MSTTPAALHWPSLTQDQRNIAVARHVLKYEVDLDGHPAMRLPNERSGDRTFESWVEIPDYVEDANAALHLLHTRPEYCELQKGANGFWLCVIGGVSQISKEIGHSKRYPAEAICLALLRASGVVVEES